jgi:membrane fusion protein, multidrug efflux system
LGQVTPRFAAQPRLPLTDKSKELPNRFRSERMGHLNSTNLGDPLDRQDYAEGSSAPRSRWWVWLLILAVAVAAGIWYFRDSKASAQAQNGGAPGSPGQAGRPGMPFGPMTVPGVVATAQKTDLPVYLNGLGTVTAFNTVTVRSRVDGQIVKINFTEGQMVHQGDPLVEIDPRPYQVQLEQAEGQLAKDQAQLKDVQVDYDRYQLLFKEGVIPKQQVDTQTAQVGQFEGAIKADQGTIDSAKLQITYSHVTAPISGRIGLRLVDMGNIVHASDAGGLLVITQLQPISVIFSLPQDQLSEVLAKMHGNQQLPVEAYDRDDTTKIASGKLLTIDNQIDITTGTYKLKATFSNENNTLFPNQFVNTHLLVDTRRNMTSVPAAAVQRGPQNTYVYVVQPDNTVKIQNVTTALTSGNFVGISSGVQPGDVVVIDGQDKLQDGSKIEARTPTGGSVNASGDQRPSPAPTSSSPQSRQPAKKQ